MIKTIQNILLILAGFVIAVSLLGWLGLQVQPQSFPFTLIKLLR